MPKNKGKEIKKGNKKEIAAYLLQRYPNAKINKMSNFMAEKLGCNYKNWEAAINDVIKTQNLRKNTEKFSHVLYVETDEKIKINYDINKVIEGVNFYFEKNNINHDAVTKETLDSFFAGFTDCVQNPNPKSKNIEAPQENKIEIEEAKGAKLILLNELDKKGGGPLAIQELMDELMQLKGILRSEKLWFGDINFLSFHGYINEAGGSNRKERRNNTLQITEQGNKALNACQNIEREYQDVRAAQGYKLKQINPAQMQMLQTVQEYGDGVTEEQLKQSIKGAHEFKYNFEQLFKHGILKKNERKLLVISNEKLVEFQIEIPSKVGFFFSTDASGERSIQRIYEENKQHYALTPFSPPVLNELFIKNTYNFYLLPLVIKAMLIGDPASYQNELKTIQAVNLPIIAIDSERNFLLNSQQELITPLIVACYLGNPKQVRELLEAGANLNFQQPFTRKSALYWSITSKKNSETKLAIFNIFLNKQINLNLKDEQGNTILHTMVEQNEIACVEKCIESTENTLILEKNNAGYSPLLLAVYLEKIEVIKVILNKMKPEEIKNFSKSENFNNIIRSKIPHQASLIQECITRFLMPAPAPVQSFSPSYFPTLRIILGNNIATSKKRGLPGSDDSDETQKKKTKEDENRSNENTGPKLNTNLNK